MANLKDHLVLETVLKRREQAEENRIYSNLQEERKLQEDKQKSRVPRLKTAASFVASALNRKKSLNALRSRMSRKKPNLSGSGGSLLVVKIHVSVHADNNIKKALKTLNLGKRYSAVIVKDNPETIELLKIADPFITYGPATAELIESLLRKRGRLLHKGKETLLKDNVLIEEALGEVSIICLEDLVHELAHPSDHFDAAKKLLLPFQMNQPAKKFKKTPFERKGDYGFRGEKIGDVVAEMNCGD